MRSEFALVEAGFDAVESFLNNPVFTGNVSIAKATPILFLNASASGQTVEYTWASGGFNRWKMNKTSDSELGANFGSHLEINRYSDAGGYLGTVLWASRTNGIVVIGSRTPTAGGAKLQTVDGLTFPATQVSNSNVNTLDDYEEGGDTASWTPADGSSDALSFSSLSGQYVKVGCMCFVQAQITYPATAGSQACNIIGLPFGQRASVTRASLAVGFCDAAFAVNAYVRGSGSGSGTYIQLNKAIGGATVLNSEMSGKTIFVSGWLMAD